MLSCTSLNVTFFIRGVSNDSPRSSHKRRLCNPTEWELHPDTKCPTTRLRFPVAHHSMRLRAVYTREPTGNHTTNKELKVGITLAHPESHQFQIVPDILLSLLMI